jgi:hypothetical protein
MPALLQINFTTSKHFTHNIEGWDCKSDKKNVPSLTDSYIFKLLFPWRFLRRTSGFERHRDSTWRRCQQGLEKIRAQSWTKWKPSAVCCTIRPWLKKKLFKKFRLKSNPRPHERRLEKFTTFKLRRFFLICWLGSKKLILKLCFWNLTKRP